MESYHEQGHASIALLAFVLLYMAMCNLFDQLSFIRCWVVVIRIITGAL
jgi:hypothetical protein